MNQVQDMLDSVWGTEIISFDLNMLEHRLHLEIKIIDFEKEQIRIIDFEDITSFYWNHNYSIKESKTEKPDNWNFLDLISIIYHQNKAKIDVKILTELDKIKSHIKNLSYPNIAIEIWNSILLIEAQTVRIDGNLFNLKL